MEIGKQIKKLRTGFNFSQEELAEKIYVSRQTISNWENDKSYPDLKSLVLVSNLFNITLDALVKGDIEEMKQGINTDDIKQFNRTAHIFTVLLLAVMILPVPLFKILGDIGWVIWGMIFVFSFCYSIKVEKLKKSFNVQTYKEIIAFVEGKPLDNNQQNQEKGKRIYQKILIVIGVALLTGLITIIMDIYIK